MLLTWLWPPLCVFKDFHWFIRRFPSYDIPDQVSKTGVALRLPTSVIQLCDVAVRPQQVTITLHGSCYFVLLADQLVTYLLEALFLWNSSLTAPNISASSPENNFVKDFGCRVGSFEGVGHLTFPVIPAESACLHLGNYWLLFFLFFFNNIFLFALIPLLIWRECFPRYRVYNDLYGFFFYYRFWFRGFRSFNLEHVEFLIFSFFAVVNIDRTRAVSMAPNNRTIFYDWRNFGIFFMN